MTLLQDPPALDARPPVDPRFRRRWAEARRQEGRRRLRVRTGAVVAVAVVAGGFGALHSPLFKVRRVLVYGNAHTPRAQVLAAAGLAAGHGDVPMVDAGPARAVRAVDALPWVADVRFARHWPWTLGITVTERSPAALVRAGAGTDVVDGTGRVLEVLAAGAALPRLPRLPGLAPAAPGHDVSPAPGLDEPEIHELLAAAAAAPAALDRRGLVLSYSASAGLVATVGAQVPAARVVLGGASQVGFKLAVLEELAQHVDLGNYSLVDLTVPQRPALTPLAGSNDG